MLNENGYYRPTYNEIVSQKEQKARELFGEDIDTSELTPLGKFIRINAYDLASAYEDLEYIYYARFPNTASGINLDRLCVFAGITRKPATRARRTIRVFGEQNYEIHPYDLEVCGIDTDITFRNLTDAKLDQELEPNDDAEPLYYNDFEVICSFGGTDGNIKEITGTTNVIAQIDRIIDISDYESCAFGTPVLEFAVNTESDIELRKRFSQTIVGVGACNVNSIRAAILKIAGVKSVNVTENNTDSTVSGRPPHSFECIVNGGTGSEQAIAQAIFEKKPIGIKPCSTATGDDVVTKTIIDDSGTSHSISFSRTATVNIHIALSYKKNAQFEQGGETQIKNALMEYVNSLGVDGDVILSSLYGYIYRVTGVTDVTALTIGKTSGSLSASNITINANETANLIAENIILSEVE